MAATLCGAIDNRCSLTIDINLCVLSGMAWYVRCKVLNLACIDSAPCSPKVSCIIVQVVEHK